MVKEDEAWYVEEVGVGAGGCHRSCPLHVPISAIPRNVS